MKHRRHLAALVLVSFSSCATGDADPAPTDATPPGDVASFMAVAGDAKVTLSWTHPPDSDFAGVTVRRTLGAPPSSPVDGAEAYAGAGTSAVDDGLTNGVRVYYKIFARDEAGNHSAGVTAHAVPNPEARVEVSFPGVGAKGIFDPSLAFDPSTGRLWMSYSEVQDSVMWPGQNDMIQTRLAWSEDGGATWTDSGSVLNPAQDITLPLAAPNNAGTWNNEVSCLVRDPGAPAPQRWKVLWHRYLWMNGNRMFDHGWIAMKTAPAPTGPWSSEHKLFVGSIYDPTDDAILGPPEVRLHQLDPDLDASLVFTEPGLLATADALFVALLAAEGASTNGRIALFKLPHATATWEYRGSLLVNAQDGPAFYAHGFSAPEMFEQDGVPYLMVTPQTSDRYEGALGFPIEDLDNAALHRNGGVPETAFRLEGTAGSHNGAAGYVFEAAASGILYSEVLLAPPLFFRIYASRKNP